MNPAYTENAIKLKMSSLHLTYMSERSLADLNGAQSRGWPAVLPYGEFQLTGNELPSSSSPTCRRHGGM